MNPLQLWMEGYKARGESCKQGGIVAAVLIAFLGASGKVTGVNSFGFWAAVVFALAVGFSALAWLFLGRALTCASVSLANGATTGCQTTAPAPAPESTPKTAPESAPTPAVTILAVQDVIRLVGWQLPAANVIGVLEIVFLVIGLVLTVLAVG